MAATATDSPRAALAAHPFCANIYTGATRIGRGTLGLNFADATFTTTAPTSNIISSSSRLVFDGESTLALTGKSGVQTSQTFNGTTLNGFGFVTLAAGANNAGSGVVLNTLAPSRVTRVAASISHSPRSSPRSVPPMASSPRQRTM